MKILKLYFRGNKAQLLALNWFCQAHPDVKLADLRPMEVR